MKSVLVTGGTGTLGKPVVANLTERGVDVRVLTRRRETTAGQVTGDLATGDGLDDAVRGVDTIIHCATHPRHHRVDIGGTQRLLEVARAGGVAHLVYISIVGIDDNPFIYYRTKLRVERLIAGSGVPYTVLRATQFHHLILGLVSAVAKLPVAPVLKGVRSQPIDIGALATRLVDLASGEPVGRATDVGGPEVVSIEDALHAYCSVVGKARKALRIPFPGKAGAAFRAGANLLGPDGETLGGTFDEFLARRFPR